MYVAAFGLKLKNLNLRLKEETRKYPNNNTTVILHITPKHYYKNR